MKGQPLDSKPIFKKLEEYFEQCKNISGSERTNTVNYDPDIVFQLLYPYIRMFFKAWCIYDEDVIQDFLILFYTKLPYLLKNYNSEKSSVTTYFVIAVKTKYLEYTRKKKADRQIKYSDQNIEDIKLLSVADGEDKTDNPEKEEIVKIIGNLNRTDQTLFLLYYYEILSPELIQYVASISGIDVLKINALIERSCRMNVNQYKRYNELLSSFHSSRKIEKQRQIIEKLSKYNITADIKGMSELLNISENSIRIRLSRIRKKLTEMKPDRI